MLHFGAAGYRPSAGALVALAKAFGLSAQAGRGIRAEVLAAVAGWRGRFADYGISEGDVARLAPDIEARLRVCGG